MVTKNIRKPFGEETISRCCPATVITQEDSYHSVLKLCWRVDDDVMLCYVMFSTRVRIFCCLLFF